MLDKRNGFDQDEFGFFATFLPEYVMRIAAIFVVCMIIGCDKGQRAAPASAMSKAAIPAATEKEREPEKKFTTAEAPTTFAKADWRNAIPQDPHLLPHNRKQLEFYCNEMIPYLTETLQDNDDGKRLEAFRTMARRASFCTSPEHRNYILLLFKERNKYMDAKPDSFDAKTELDYVLDHVVTAPQVLNVITNAIADRRKEIRDNAFAVLMLLGPRAKASAVRLLQIADEQTGNARCLACEALWWIERNPNILSRLEKELRDSDTARQSNACSSLSRIVGASWYDREKNREWELLQTHWNRRQTQFDDQDNVSEEAKSNTELILSAARHLSIADNDVRRAFSGKTSIMLPLAAVDSDKASADDNLLREIIRKLGDADKHFDYPLLCKKALDAADAEHTGAKRLLNALPVSEKEYAGLTELYRCLLDPKEKARRESALSLLKRLRVAEAELDYLATAMQDAAFREGAVAAAVPRLVQAIGSTDGGLRKKAAERLQAFGPPALKAEPSLVKVLVKALQDQDLDARYAAGQALKAIDPESARKALVP